eukprot:NODE_3303_length_804_cov_3.210948.p1 GENE.NODE_3303_length_804_cov_3.210948~~NODE_3303_length_804_cov_3.210948.p1  ORF type:complete len:179 (-),score=53.74 NODE_3303_length_804_cov_3.210948:145-681(-)
MKREGAAKTSASTSVKTECPNCHTKLLLNSEADALLRVDYEALTDDEVDNYVSEIQQLCTRAERHLAAGAPSGSDEHAAAAAPQASEAEIVKLEKRLHRELEAREAPSCSGAHAAAASSSSKAAKRLKRYKRKLLELEEKGETIQNFKHLSNQGKNNRAKVAELLRQLEELIKVLNER